MRKPTIEQLEQPVLEEIKVVEEIQSQPPIETLQISEQEMAEEGEGSTRLNMTPKKYQNMKYIKGNGEDKEKKKEELKRKERLKKIDEQKHFEEQRKKQEEKIKIEEHKKMSKKPIMIQKLLLVFLFQM